ncbi:histidine kinase [Pseudanabaena sp. SR411]|uniref:GAF domain-containing protein n=1 Tax=Pseudanabaena sp. SR411 TaxID=1980935 RepID=UPI000B98C956|nr:GAF domain-containing protein [Pseudanabaena sp. SR411]OYQ64790.1 histidine kinase [Pseudanabaena sp. SR411]
MAGKKATKLAKSESLNANKQEALKLIAQPEITDALEKPQFAQQKALFSVIAKIRESLDLESIFKSTAIEVRQLLNADRVGMYRFDETSTFTCGEFVSEDVLPEFASTLTAKINDHCFGKNHAKYYQQGRIWACADIYAQDLPECHIQILERFQVQANLVVPLLNGDRLWGLLCIHQCSAPRQWLDSEIDFVKQIAMHLDVALQQSEFVAQLRSQSEYLTRAIEQAVGREKAVAAIINKIRRSLNLDTIFKTTTEEVRQLLQADRVTIYRFNSDWSGEFVVESMTEGLRSLVDYQKDHPELNANISECTLKNLTKPLGSDTYLQETQGGNFSIGQLFRVCDDIYVGGFSTCYIEALERYQARAYAIIAIYKGKDLWGLLAAFQSHGVRQWQEPEVNFLVQIGTQLGIAIQQAELFGQVQKRSTDLQTTLEIQLQKRANELARDAEQERALAQVIDKIRRTLDIDTIFQTATTEVRKLLNSDRVGVFQFDSDDYTNGTFVSEDVLPEYISALEAKVRDHCFGNEYIANYQVGRFKAIADIYEEGLSDCHIAILERFQVRANLVIPLYKGSEIWGLLCIHQCSNPRQWQSKEIEFVSKIAIQLGVALQQAELFSQSQNQTIELQKALAKVQAQTTQQAKAAEQERALARVIERIRQTLDIDAIFLATTQEVRQNLNCDRVVVYRFFEDWSGEFVFESKTDDWLPLDQLFNCDNIWEDTYLQEHQGGRYRKHESLAVNDIYKANLTDCHIQILESYQIQAYMVVPVFVGDKLWGLLAAYQNSGSRNWETSELSLLTQVGNQLGVAVQQVELLVQLKKAKDNADAANRAKGDFLAHMSHELRTPLNSILGFTQVLARDPLLNHTQKEHLGIIARSGEHLLTLLNDVLEMSKIEAGLIELNTNSFDLYNLLNNLKEMFLLKAKSKNLQLVFDFAANVPQYVQTDESKLRQVLINLVGNAVKFTNQGQVILQVAKLETDETIAAEDQEGTDSVLYFEVTDTGPGIAVEELDHLFEAFVQTETGRRSQDGTGLGMPISRRFVQLMGGDIQVESTWGKGTIVSFNIKVQMAQASSVPPPQVKRRAIALAPNQPKYRILLADDKWESRHLMKNLLAPLEFEIREAENGREAIAIWQLWKPHLIWMDMQMPVMDGYEATRAIRAAETPDSACKIVALTASVFDKQRSVVLELGCDDFVSKPLREGLIFDKIAEHLGVVYIYAENNPPDPTSNQESSHQHPPITQELDSLERQWLESLHLAARGADEEAIFALLEQVQTTHPATVSVIQDLVQNFHLDQLVKLIQPFLNLQANES